MRMRQSLAAQRSGRGSHSPPDVCSGACGRSQVPLRANHSSGIGTAVSRERAKFFSRSHDAVIRVYDEAGNVIETHEHKGDFKVMKALFRGRALLQFF
jgi:hypothetical protein